MVRAFPASSHLRLGLTPFSYLFFRPSLRRVRARWQQLLDLDFHHVAQRFVIFFGCRSRLACSLSSPELSSIFRSFRASLFAFPPSFHSVFHLGSMALALLVGQRHLLVSCLFMIIHEFAHLEPSALSISTYLSFSFQRLMLFVVGL